MINTPELYDYEELSTMDFNDIWVRHAYLAECQQEVDRAVVAYQKNNVFVHVDRYVREFTARQGMRELRAKVQNEKR